MDYDKGFICITNPQWNCTLSINNCQTACIWLRKTSFKPVSKGEPIFFVEKVTRLLRGYGTFERFEVNSTKVCWEKYGISSGAESFEDLLLQLNFPNEEKGWNKEIGNIIISNIHWINNDIYIHNTKVDLPKATVTGKTINSTEVKKLLSYF